MNRIEGPVPHDCERIVRTEELGGFLPPFFRLGEIPAQVLFAHLHGEAGRRVAVAPAGEVIQGEIVGDLLPVGRPSEHIEKRRGEVADRIEAGKQSPGALLPP